MRKFGVIHTRFWSWALENNLSDVTKLIGVYLLSCEHGNSLGCFRCPPAYVSFDLGYPVDTVSIGYAELENLNFIQYCEGSHTVFLPKYLQWNPPMNKKHAIGIINIVKELPSSFSHADMLLKSLQKYVSKFLEEKHLKILNDTLSIPYEEGMDTVSIPYRYTEPEPEPEPDIKTPGEPGTFFSENKSVKNQDFTGNLSSVFLQINKSCEDILRLPTTGKKPFDPRKWAQQKINNTKHPGAVAKSLDGLKTYWGRSKDPWAYCDTILSKVNGNFNEAEAIQHHEELKAMKPRDLAFFTNGLFQEMS